MTYKSLFIDLDDTIWDTRSNGKESMEEVYRDYGFDRFFPSFDDFYAIYFPNNCRLWDLYRDGKITKDELILERLLFPLKPFGIDDKSFILDLNEDYLNRTAQKTKLLPHALEILEYLRPRYQMIILSNGFREVQYKKINYSGLTPFFDDVILSEDAGYNKPHPQIFNYALQKMNVKKEEVLMIGDSWEADMVGAYNSGIDQVWYDLELETPNGFEPTYRIKSLLELKDIV